MKNIFNFKHYDIIKSEIGNIEPNNYYHFFTKGRWSSHELLLYLLSYSGQNSKVIITTFSLSEITIRTYLKAIQNQYISDLQLLLNTSIKRYKTDLMFFANKVVSKIGLEKSHMKITLIENNNLNIVVNQSANSTINPAHEAGVICTYKKIYDDYLVNINEIFKTSILLNNDINK